MKILFLSDEFPPHVTGGPGLVVAHLARGFIARGHDVAVLTTVRREEDAHEYVYDGIRVIALQSAYHERYAGYLSLYRPSMSRRVTEVLKQFQPDVVHAHNIHFHLTYDALRLAKNSGARVILTAHDCMLFHYGKFTSFIDPHDLTVRSSYEYKIGWWEQLRTFKRRYNPLRNMVIRRYLKNVDVICSVSDEHKKVLEANRITPVTTVYNGLDIGSWKSDPADTQVLTRRLNLQDRSIILFSGRLSEAKGLEQLYQAFVRAAGATKNKVALVLLGKSNAFVEDLLVRARKAGVTIVVTGWMGENDLPNVYALSDVVAFPSICFDTFGMVNIEAMASHKPVLATCFGGAREVVVDSETGYVINPFDIARFAQLLTKLVDDPALAGKMGEKGYARVVEKGEGAGGK